MIWRNIHTSKKPMERVMSLSSNKSQCSQQKLGNYWSNSLIVMRTRTLKLKGWMTRWISMEHFSFEVGITMMRQTRTRMALFL